MKDLKNLSKNELISLWQQLQAISQEESKECGDVALLWHLAKGLELPEILDAASGKRDQGEAVGLLTLIMAIHRDCDPSSKLALLEWYPKTILPQLTKLEVEKLNYHDLLRSLDYWTDQAIAAAEVGILLQLSLKFGIGPKGVGSKALVWDSTSTYFEAETNRLIKFGYSRDKRPDLPQVNIELFIDPDKKLPLYSRSYEGNMVDVQRFPDALKQLSFQYPDWRPELIADCGVISDETLELLSDLGYDFLFGLPKKGRWLEILKQVKQFEAGEGFYLKGVHYQAHRKRINFNGQRLQVWVIKNLKEAKRQAMSREKSILKCQKQLQALEAKLGKRFLKSRHQIKQRVAKVLETHKVSPFLKVSLYQRSSNFQLKVELKQRALKRQAKLDGCRLLISSSSERYPNAKEALSRYRSKNSAEQAFGMVKGPIGIRPVFHYNEQHIKGHVFVCHLALLLRCVLKLLLDSAGLGITATKALKLVKSVYATKLSIPLRGLVLWSLNVVSFESHQIFEAAGLDLVALFQAEGLLLPP
jgi:transposase